MDGNPGGQMTPALAGGRWLAVRPLAVDHQPDRAFSRSGTGAARGSLRPCRRSARGGAESD
jgi:hypothetical protein